MPKRLLDGLFEGLLNKDKNLLMSRFGASKDPYSLMSWTGGVGVPIGMPGAIEQKEEEA